MKIKLHKINYMVFFHGTDAQIEAEEKKQEENEYTYKDLYQKLKTGRIDWFSFSCGRVLHVLNRSIRTAGYITMSDFVIIDGIPEAASHFDYDSVEKFLHGYYSGAANGVTITYE